MRFLILFLLMACNGETETYAQEDETGAVPEVATVGCQIHLIDTDPEPSLGAVCDKALTMEGKAFTKTALGWSEPMQMRIKGEKGDIGPVGPAGPPGPGATLPEKYAIVLDYLSEEDPVCCKAGMGSNEGEDMRLAAAQFIKFHLGRAGHGADHWGPCSSI